MYINYKRTSLHSLTAHTSKPNRAPIRAQWRWWWKQLSRIRRRWRPYKPRTKSRGHKVVSTIKIPVIIPVLISRVLITPSPIVIMMVVTISTLMWTTTIPVPKRISMRWVIIRQKSSSGLMLLKSRIVVVGPSRSNWTLRPRHMWWMIPSI